MMRWSVSSMLIVFASLLTGYFSAAVNLEGQGRPLNSVEVLKLLDFVGIPAKSAIFLHRERIGNPPQVPQDVCFYKVKLQDAEWTVGVDVITHKIVMLQGEVVFLAGGKSQRIGRHEDAVRLADVWFQRFGVEVGKTIVWEVIRQDRYNGVWKVARERVLAPSVIVRTGATIELDEETGGLLSFALDPDFVIPTQLPVPAISRRKAIALAFEQIAETSTKHYEPSKDAQLLDCFQFITWKRRSDGQLTAHLYWRMRFYGRAKRISHLPPEFQVEPSQAVPVLWHVLVDAITGEVDIHWVSQRSEIFTDGKLYKW